MASFTVPFDPTALRMLEDLVITIPMPPETVRSPDESLLRPGISRYAGSQLTLMHVTDNGTAFNISSPVYGTGRKVSLSSTLPGNISQLVEISVLPFSSARVLSVLKQGAPTFYLGYNPTSGDLPADDDFLKPDTPIASVRGDAFIGLLFQDRVTLAPWTWFEILRSAMVQSGDLEGAASWNNLSSLYPNSMRSIRVLDHVGNLLPNQTFQIRILQENGSYDGPWTRSCGEDGDLEKAIVTNPIVRSTGTSQPSLFGSVNEQTELFWNGKSSENDVSLPVICAYEVTPNIDTSPEAPILLPPRTGRYHIQTLELAEWFAPRVPGITLPRYHSRSRIEPLIDGIPSFIRILNDLNAATGSGKRAHFAGWAFNDFPLGPNSTDTDTRLTAIVKNIRNNQGDVRFLVNKFINFKEIPDSDVNEFASYALLALVDALILLSIFKAYKTDSIGFLVVFAGLVIAEALIKRESLEARIKEAGESSKDIVDELNDIQNNLAVWSPYPMRLIDNPVAMPFPLGLDRYIDKFGSWHQKIQLMKVSSNDLYVAYVGGIDINEDRLDTPSHQVMTPMHDVHARITGPAAADVFNTWNERYGFEIRTQEDLNGPLDPVFDPPTPEMLPLQDAKHIVQIGRTYFKRNPRGDTEDEDVLYPSGDTGINDTLIRAIKAAREYIYIEDQYFTPNDQPEGLHETCFDALIEAASSNSKRLRLIIIVPAETDQPFGEVRRRYLFNRLREAWGNRIFIGVPLRRPILSNPGRIASEGRCILMVTITQQSSSIVIGPRARVPTTRPFWIWVEGELMISTRIPTETTIDNIPCMEINVLRGHIGTIRKHSKGTAVTLSQLKGIYVHAKVMMIDDIFVSIGSANLNRRGLMNDGEINVFAVPEDLKAAADNPALRLRTDLWAEHLGLRVSMGRSLLKDPAAAFDLFLRTIYQGNRTIPFRLLNLKEVPDLSSITIGDTLTSSLLGLIAVWTESQMRAIWNNVSDPTSFNEEFAVEGPSP